MFKQAVVISLSNGNVTRKNINSNLNPMSQCSYLSALLGLKLGGHISNMNSVKFKEGSEFGSKILPETIDKLENLVSYTIIVAWIRFTSNKVFMQQ